MIDAAGRAAAPRVGSQPLLTAGMPGIGGRIKAEPEDFRVEEVPLVSPSGRGDHLWIHVEKRRLTTHEAVARLARYARVSPGEVRLAGLKDRAAVTRQWLSIRGLEPTALAGLDAATGGALAVVDAIRHTQPLRVGELRGNRFWVRVRGVVPDALALARPIVAACVARGVPNFFGEQRYGLHGDNHLVIAEFLRGDAGAAVDRVLSGSLAAAGPPAAAARERFEAGDLAGVLRALPKRCDAERRLLRALVDRALPAEAALGALPKPLLWLFLSAYQSWVFDRCLEARMGGLGADALVPGDLELDHRTAMISLVPLDEPRDSAVARARGFESSATGPIIGPGMVRPEGEPGRVEAAAIGEIASEADVARLRGLFEGIDPVGTRRALRFRVREAEVREEPANGERSLVLGFFLDRGAYATTFLRELTKTPVSSVEDEGEEDR